MRKVLNKDFLKNIELSLKKELSINLKFSLSESLLEKKYLSPEQKNLLESWKSETKINNSLRGKKALFQLNPEFTNIIFPHPKISLTHSKNLALAVHTDNESIHGMGIDFEYSRNMKIGIEKFFLQSEELYFLEKFDVLCLWTIKEAVFKADIDNQKYRLLKAYKIKKIHLNEEKKFFSGYAVSPDGKRIEFMSFNLNSEGFLSIALVSNK